MGFLFEIKAAIVWNCVKILKSTSLSWLFFKTKLWKHELARGATLSFINDMDMEIWNRVPVFVGSLLWSIWTNFNSDSPNKMKIMFSKTHT